MACWKGRQIRVPMDASLDIDGLARQAADRRPLTAAGFTGVKLEYPWGRHFLGVCLLVAMRPKYRYAVLGSRYRERCTRLPRPAAGRIAAAVSDGAAVSRLVWYLRSGSVVRDIRCLARRDLFMDLRWLMPPELAASTAQPRPPSGAACRGPEQGWLLRRPFFLRLAKPLLVLPAPVPATRCE